MTLLLAMLLACGKERWSEKVASDPAAYSIQLEPQAASIEELYKLPPLPKRYHGGRLEHEKRVVRLRAYVIGWKGEEDGDLHVVIRDEQKRTMIVEFPGPECVDGSRLKQQINQARHDFQQWYGFKAPRSFKRVPPRLWELEGVMFSDFQHGQTGVAPNAVEIHPVSAARRAW